MTLDAARQAGTSAVGEVLEMTHDKTKGVPMQVTSADRLRTHHAVRQASRLGRLATHGVSEAEIEKMIRLDVAWGQGHRCVSTMLIDDHAVDADSYAAAKRAA